MPKHLRDESNEEVRAFVRAASTWPLWVDIDDAVTIYTTTDMSELLLEDPPYGKGVMQESVLCFDAEELTKALRVWFEEL